MAWIAPKIDWTPPDGAADADFNRIEGNILHLKEQHVDLTTGIHGAVSAPTASKLVIRDAAGRAQVAAPSAEEDIAIKATVTAHATDTANPHGVTKTQVGLSAVINVEQMPLAGGTFTGKAYAQSNTDYTVGQIRSIFYNTIAPTTEGSNGDAWFQYEA